MKKVSLVLMTSILLQHSSYVMAKEPDPIPKRPDIVSPLKATDPYTSLGLAAKSMGEEVSVEELNKVLINKAEQVAVSKSTDPKVALEQMLAEAKVDPATRAQFKSVLGNLKTVKVNGVEQYDPSSLKSISTLVQKTLAAKAHQDGSLNFASCNLLTVSKWTLAALGVIGGIIYIAIPKSVSQIRKNYSNKRITANNEYNDNVYYIKNAVTIESTRVIRLQSDRAIESRNYNSILDAIDSREDYLYRNRDTISQAEYDEVLAQIDGLEYDLSVVASRLDRIDQDITFSLIQIAKYSNPDYVEEQINYEIARYESLLVSLDIQEEDQIDNLPNAQKTAKAIGVTAAVSAGVGAALFGVSGFADCQ